VFFNAVASPRVSITQKSENHVSAGKVMATIFWDCKGVLHVDFLTEHHTINAEYYSARPSKDSHQEQEKKGANISVISPGKCPSIHGCLHHGHHSETEMEHSATSSI